MLTELRSGGHLRGMGISTEDTIAGGPHTPRVSGFQYTTCFKCNVSTTPYPSAEFGILRPTVNT